MGSPAAPLSGRHCVRDRVYCNKLETRILPPRQPILESHQHVPLVGAERSEISVMQQNHISALSIARTQIALSRGAPAGTKRAIFMFAALSRNAARWLRLS
jgi:hypothetical protein